MLRKDSSPLIQPKDALVCRVDGAWLFDLAFQSLWAEHLTGYSTYSVTAFSSLHGRAMRSHQISDIGIKGYINTRVFTSVQK